MKRPVQPILSNEFVLSVLIAGLFLSCGSRSSPPKPAEIVHLGNVVFQYDSAWVVWNDPNQVLKGCYYFTESQTFNSYYLCWEKEVDPTSGAFHKGKNDQTQEQMPPLYHQAISSGDFLVHNWKQFAFDREVKAPKLPHHTELSGISTAAYRNLKAQGDTTYALLWGYTPEKLFDYTLYSIALFDTLIAVESIASYEYVTNGDLQIFQSPSRNEELIFLKTHLPVGPERIDLKVFKRIL